jgi:ElaB/YqjD/DUF883 family membrane-anchored ribosome-binding protein
LDIQKDEDITELISKVEHVKKSNAKTAATQSNHLTAKITAPLIIEAIRKAGHVVTKLSLQKPTLNEVYMSILGALCVMPRVP